MSDFAHSSNPVAGRRLFGREAALVAFIALAFLVTAAIAGLQTALRAQAIDDIFYRLFTDVDYTASFLFIATLLAVLAVPRLQSLAVALARWFGSHPLIVASSCCAVLALAALEVYQAHPLSMAEASVYMQAKIFAHGRLVGNYPPGLLDRLIFPPFQNGFINVSRQSGEIASSYFPGFALLLTPFMAAGVPWLCNPVIGALGLWVIHRLTFALTASVEAAGAAVLFTLGSAAFLINSISFYSMPAVLLCNATLALLLLRPTPRRCLAAGVVGGFALTLHNPFAHALFAAVWLSWLAVAHNNRWRLLAAIGIGYAPWLCVCLGWTHLLHRLATGSSPGGTAAAGLDPLRLLWLVAVTNLTPPDATRLLERTIGVAKLWLWAAPLLLPLAALGFWRQRADTGLRLLLISAAAVFIGYLFSPFSQGHGWGFRYFHSVWFVLPIAAAAALVPGNSSDQVVRTEPIGRAALAGALCGALVMTPYFAWQVHDFIGWHLAELPAGGGRPRVVFINVGGGYYIQDLVQNDPFLRDPVMRMVSHGFAEDQELIAQRFPDLVLLGQSFRGSVWGYAGATRSPASSPGTVTP
jgi:hypothetical protein